MYTVLPYLCSRSHPILEMYTILPYLCSRSHAILEMYTILPYLCSRSHAILEMYTVLPTCAPVFWFFFQLRIRALGLNTSIHTLYWRCTHYYLPVLPYTHYTGDVHGTTYLCLYCMHNVLEVYLLRITSCNYQKVLIFQSFLVCS